MKMLIKILGFAIVVVIVGYLFFFADMTWDPSQKKIVPEAENQSIEMSNMNYLVKIDELPQEVVDMMANKVLIHEAVAAALEENGYGLNEKITYVKYEQDELGDLKLHFVFGKTNNRLVINGINGEPINYELTKVVIQEVEE